MPVVEEDIRYLIQIVKKDMEIKEKKRMLGNIPPRIKAIDRELRKMDDDLNETKQILDKLDTEKRHIDQEIKAHQAELAKKKEDQNVVKDNKVFKAMNAEIEYISKKIDQAEERMLVILEDGEVRRGEVAAMTNKINSEKNKLVAEKEKLEQEMSVTDDALKILGDEKVRILPHISEGVRRLYGRILVAKGDSGVANLVGDICQGCYSRVPPQTAHEVRRNDQILKCEVCGRILVYYESK
ncbi:MAG: C4-type zinc ribbon domain-containing protein [Candidatus Krumholzibacteria bacterium]|nr:C4-type zinc ribbon domain-containing protein [Candidatus Krumholzibacteria bacterium]